MSPRAWTIVASSLIACAIGAALRPVCVPIPDEDRWSVEMPLEERTDRDLYLRVFQQRAGRWHQCKTWISRQFFF